MKIPCCRFFAHCSLVAFAGTLLACGAIRLAGKVTGFRGFWTHYSEQCARARKLATRQELTYRRILEKQEVMTTLARGRMTLREAAGRFAELDREVSPCSLGELSRLYPGNTDEERYCHLVLARVRFEATTSPALAALLPRLEDELRQFSGSNTGERGEFLGSMEGN